MTVSAKIINRGDLTVRECEVLRCVCENEPNKVIARSLAISMKTVGAHLEHITLKMQVRGESINVRCALITKAVASGMVQLSLKSIATILIFNAMQIDDDVLRARGRRHHVRAHVSSVRRGVDA